MNKHKRYAMYDYHRIAIRLIPHSQQNFAVGMGYLVPHSWQNLAVVPAEPTRPPPGELYEESPLSLWVPEYGRLKIDGNNFSVVIVL